MSSQPESTASPLWEATVGRSAERHHNGFQHGAGPMSGVAPESVSMGRDMTARRGRPGRNAHEKGPAREECRASTIG